MKEKRIKIGINILIIYSILLTICVVCLLRTLKKEQEYTDVYTKLALGKQINMLAIGDSIAEGTGASDREHKWVNLVKEYLKEQYGVEVYLENHSMPGCSAISGITTVMELPDDIKYDLVCLCYGQNDAEENFEYYYEGLVRKIRDKYPGCEILCIQESAQKGYTAKMQIIKEIADKYGYPVIDTIAPFVEGSNGGEQDYGRYSTLTEDDVHPNDEGHRIYAECVETYITSKTANRQSVQKSIRQEQKNFFDSAVWYKAEQFERDGEKYTLKLRNDMRGSGINNPFNDGTGVMLVLNLDDYPGVNGCTIKNNGIDIARRELEWTFDFPQGHTAVITNNCTLNAGEFTIMFDSEEQANGFWGIGFIGIGNEQ